MLQFPDSVRMPDSMPDYTPVLTVNPDTSVQGTPVVRGDHLLSFSIPDTSFS